jgi:hypothetical protein
MKSQRKQMLTFKLKRLMNKAVGLSSIKYLPLNASRDSSG